MSARVPFSSLNFVQGFPLTPPPGTQGTVTVEVQVDESNPPVPTSVNLSGSSTEWSASGSFLQLTPETVPAHYLLTFQLSTSSPSSQFTLVGIQVYRITLLEESSQHATLFFPAVSEQVEIHLLHGIGSEGVLVTYQLFIGVADGSGNVSWPDPTIEFDPEAGSPPFDPASEE